MHSGQVTATYVSLDICFPSVRCPLDGAIVHAIRASMVPEYNNEPNVQPSHGCFENYIRVKRYAIGGNCARCSIRVLHAESKL